MKIIYICSRDVSVYESQVLSLLSFMYNNGIDVTLLQGYQTDTEKKELDKKLELYSYLNVEWFSLCKPLPHNEKKNKSILQKALLSVPNCQHAVLHIRGVYTSHLTKEILKENKLLIPILCDVRGVELEEHIYSAKKGSLYSKIIHTFCRYYNAYTYNHFYTNDDYPLFITSVSPLINDYISNHYPNCKYPMFVHPNIAGKQFVYSDEGRKEVRKQLGYTDKDIVAICSTNSNAVWQMDYLTISTLVGMGIKVINLSSSNPNIEGCKTMKVKFVDMPNYLSAADIAVLWRDVTFMNESASPSKFSEFAVMGLYVIHNDSVYIASNHIKKYGAGCIIRDVQQIPDTIDLQSIETKRKERIQNGMHSFGIDSIGKSYIDLYNQMNNIFIK